MIFRRSVPSLRTAFAAAVAFGCFSLVTAQHATAQRLPQTVIPEHYDLKLSPDLKTATFTGDESIDVDVKQPTNSIVLNSAEIEFESVKINADGKEQTATVKVDKEKEQATLTVPQQIPAGKAVIAIHYKGILNNELRGFYLSKTKRRNYAVTQFESTDARRAYPSFDEPAFKATYNVTLVIDKGDTAISNSQIVSDTPGPGADKHTVKFDTTPKMSTYLVAFLVGDFQCTKGEADGVAIRVCSTPDKISLTPYALDVAKFALHYYNTYFGIPYPLKKLDLIGLPDFEAGAMENFGAITYRETDLLIDANHASVPAKKRVALVVAHEMAHQWFGDLVTMKWWNNVWLNEGFATWMENKATAAMHPEWNIDQDVAEDEDNTLNLDAQPTTRAIRANADTREEIEQMFDGISYGKAGAVLLMVENYLGEETFRQGVHNYLAAHLYGNATAEDFWNAQTETSHKPVDKIMESFVAQPGEPILTFGTPAHDTVEVAQKRFFLSPSIKPDPAQKWTLPVCFRTASRTETCQLLEPDQRSLSTPTTDTFFANATGKGYYRTFYTPSVYAEIVRNIETRLRPTERISLVGDEWAKFRANQATAGDYMDLVTAVKADPSADVIGTALAGVYTIDSRLASTKSEHDQLAAWIRRSFAPEYQKLGAPAATDSSNTSELRAHLFALLGYYGKDPAVLSQAHEIAEKYIADPASVDATLAQPALGIAARNGNAELFEKLQKLYETSTNPEVQVGALHLLTQFDDPELEKRGLEYAISGKVRNQDAAIEFALALETNPDRELAWSFIKEHWDAIHPMLTPELGSYLVAGTGTFCSAKDRDDVQQFFETHKVASADRTVKHAIERINGCIELRNLQENNLKKWLAAQPRQ